MRGSTRPNDSPHSVPLISLSRSPSPYARRHASSNIYLSEGEENDNDDEDDNEEEREGDGEERDDDDDGYGNGAVHVPLVASDIGRGGGGGGPRRSRSWRGRLMGGRSLGRWLLGTSAGWQVYVGLLGLLACVSAMGLAFLNRLILWSQCSISVILVSYMIPCFSREIWKQSFCVTDFGVLSSISSWRLQVGIAQSCTRLFLIHILDMRFLEIWTD